jgi:hypothetical protein
MCISVPQAELNLSRQIEGNDAYQLEFGDESRLEGQVLQMVLQQCQSLKHKRPV